MGMAHEAGKKAGKEELFKTGIQHIIPRLATAGTILGATAIGANALGKFAKKEKKRRPRRNRRGTRSARGHGRRRNK